jgi:hypothetical protein
MAGVGNCFGSTVAQVTTSRHNSRQVTGIQGGLELVEPLLGLGAALSKSCMSQLD